MTKQFMEPLKGGGAWIHGEMTMPDPAPSGPMVIGAGWMLEMVRFEDRSQTIGLFLAAFSITNFDIPEFAPGRHAAFVGFTSPGKPPAEWLQSSMLFDLGNIPLAKTPEALVALFHKPLAHRSLDPTPNASLLSKRIKRRIAETYRDNNIPIAQIAKDLGVSHAHATRQFKRDFGFTPISYRHQLRVSDATGRLMGGEDILDVGEDVGFNDTSRFYKSFRKITGSTPGKCKL
jgi:AraC-like DNA-binding protein